MTGLKTFLHLNQNFFAGIIMMVTLLFACGQKSPDQQLSSSINKEDKQVFYLVNPKQDVLLTVGQKFDVCINSIKKNYLPDSIKIYIGGELTYTSKDSSLSFPIETLSKKVGRQDLRILIYYLKNQTQTLSGRIIILADKEPAKYNYKVLRTIPHDNTSYTQGLFYNDNYIFEGTGRTNQSKLRKINPKNGEVLKELKLDSEIFGEGITMIDKKIYQLTYQSKIGFIYNAETFELIRSFDLQTFEGWGLTDNDKSLILSDGSSKLYFYDPEYITQLGQLDVCNNKGLVTRLNELEYVDGYIWANIYGEPYIAKIDAKSGIVIGTLDLENIFPKNIEKDMDHVLNGIAYNETTQTFYITGKLWPVIYEIDIIE